MSARYDSSPSNLRALRDRLTAVAKRKVSSSVDSSSTSVSSSSCS